MNDRIRLGVRDFDGGRTREPRSDLSGSALLTRDLNDDL
jgi:hypothetical protein